MTLKMKLSADGIGEYFLFFFPTAVKKYAKP
jgi:hypothetical protein